MKICFRSDASLEIGIGHIMRCLTLARAFERQGWECVFACQPRSSESVMALQSGAFNIITMPSDQDDQSSVLRAVEPDGVDILVVDHYGLGESFETSCGNWAKKIIVIDDMPNRPHYADILLDQTYGRDGDSYKPLVPEQCSILTGSKYALLRPEFSTLRPLALTRRKANAIGIERVLVSFGSSDPNDITSVVLEVIKQACLNVAIDVVLSANAPHLSKVRQQIKTLNNSNLFIDISGIAGLMGSADIAIGATGSSSWERCCLGLPALTVVLAENQREINIALSQAGAVETLGYAEQLTANVIKEKLVSLVRNPKQLKMMSEAASKICDGRGVMRTMHYVMDMMSKSKMNKQSKSSRW